MGQKFLPLDADIAKFVTQGAFTPQGEEGAIKLGDIEACTYTPTYTTIERYSREYPTKTLTASDTIQTDGAVAMTLLSMTKLTYAALFGDAVESVLEQAAAAGQTKTFAAVKVGRIYNLGYRDVTITSADDGSAGPVAWVEGTHYRAVEETGDIEVLAIPATAGPDLHVEFDAAAILASADRGQWGLMANDGIRGKLTLWGISDIGQNLHVELWDVRLRPTGDVAFQGGDDYTQVQVSGKLFADGSKGNKFRYGRVTAID